MGISVPFLLLPSSKLIIYFYVYFTTGEREECLSLLLLLFISWKGEGLSWRDGICRLIRKGCRGTAWKNSPLFRGAAKVLPQASSQHHEPQWTGPGEQLWFSVLPKCVPYRWQVLGAYATPTSRGDCETCTASAGREDARASPGIQSGRGKRGRG